MDEPVKLVLPRRIETRIKASVAAHSSSIWAMADAGWEAYQWFRSQEEYRSIPASLIWMAIARIAEHQYSADWFKKKASVARAFPAPRKWRFGYYERIFDLAPAHDPSEPEPGTREHCLEWLQTATQDDEFGRVPGATTFMLTYQKDILGDNLIPAVDGGVPSEEAVADHLIDRGSGSNYFGAFIWGMDQVRANISQGQEDVRVQKVLGLIDELKEALPACLEALGMKQDISA